VNTICDDALSHIRYGACSQEKPIWPRPICVTRGHFDQSPSERASQNMSQWLGHGGVFQPQAGTGDVRFLAFRFIAANDHPDHNTIATFRRRFLKDIEPLFVQMLLLAREMRPSRAGVTT
jgi:hypothetical protein